MGPERNSAGYFLTPQTNPPTPWPAEKFEQLFGAEVTEGMVVPRQNDAVGAGIVTAIADRAGMTQRKKAWFAEQPAPQRPPACGLSSRIRRRGPG